MILLENGSKHSDGGRYAIRDYQWVRDYQIGPSLELTVARESR
jgi:hypothetical protein